MDKQIVLPPSNGMLYSNKKAQTTDMCNNMDESQKHYAKWKKPKTKDYILYDLIYMTFWKRKNYRDRSVVARAGVGERDWL